MSIHHHHFRFAMNRRARSLAAAIGIGPILGVATCIGASAKDEGKTTEPLQITFYEHIAPIVHSKCSSCHREGEAGPFSLITYDEVRKKAGTIKRVVNDRYMPPWHPVPGHGEFADVRRLTDDQVALINAWIEQGKAEGDPDKAPSPPKFPEGWQLGEPDIILTMKEAFPVPADGPDIYRNFVLPLDLPEDKWVKAVEMRPSARSVVHHSLFFLDDSGTARQMDGEDGKPGFRGMGFRRTGSLGGYVPGAQPKFLPGDLALPLSKGSDLVLSTHFHPSGKAEQEQTTFGIYLADKAPSRRIVGIQVPPAFGRGMGIDIPAGESDYRIEDTFTLPVDVEAISIGGHAHYVCEEMKMTATLPDGTTNALLYIDNWDLNWQDRYEFKEPVKLPAGTVLKTELRYDNSADNPDNPFSPPRRIMWGRESTDEMGSVTLMVVPEENSDLTKLTRASGLNQAKVLTQLGREAGSGQMLERLPQIIQTLDSSGDGKIQLDEAPGRLKTGAVFNRLDADGDGGLDQQELEALGDLLEKFRPLLDRRRGETGA